jgi:hypothetical protein
MLGAMVEETQIVFGLFVQSIGTNVIIWQKFAQLFLTDQN